MDSLGNLIVRKAKKIESLRQDSSAIRRIVSEYVESDLQLNAEILRDIYLDRSRLVIVVSHKAYASIINAHKDRILEAMKRFSTSVSSITIF